MDNVLVDRHVTCAASRARSQRPALLQAAAETTASGSTGKEDLKADRRVRHYKEVGLQEWPLAGRATVPRVLYGIGLCMSLRRRTILSRSLRAPAPVDITIHTYRTMVNSTASSELQVELLPRLSRNLSHCCEKGLSAPGIGFSNFETNSLVFSNTSKTKRLRRWSFWYDKWFCSFKNLSRVLPSFRSNGKVGFNCGGGARD